jgi:YD repeat-containing protein
VRSSTRRLRPTAEAFHLVGDGTGLSGISDDQDGNQVGTGGSPIDALLGPLADNGGPTQTHALRVASPALDAGSDRLAVPNLPRSSAVAYGRLGRKAAVAQTDPDGIGSASAPTVTYAYDANGNLLSETDALNNSTSHTYDNLGRKVKTTDAEGGETEHTYDAVGRMTSLTDPEDNTTTWTFDPLGRVATETIMVSSSDLDRTFRYDAAGNLVHKIDRTGRVMDFAYDSLSRQTSEAW